MDEYLKETHMLDYSHPAEHKPRIKFPKMGNNNHTLGRARMRPPDKKE